MKTLVLIFIIKLVTISSKLTLNLFDKNLEARCLDGSPYGIYYSEGSNEGLKNVVISFWGGGWCAGRDRNSLLLDCLERSKTNLGSSNTWTKIEDDIGFLSGSKDKNPNFFNWHRFDVPYCDGSGHQGHVSQTITVDGKPLYFRGHKNTLAAIDFILNKVNINQLEKIVITGCSAGGLATYYWSQYLNEKLKYMNPKIKLYGLPDSGFFINHLNAKTQDFDYQQKIKVLYSIVNQEVLPESPRCLKDNKGNEYNCLFAEYLVNYIDIPILALQSAYDTWQLHNILGIDCSDSQTLKKCDNKDKLLANEYRDKQNSLLLKTINSKNNISTWSVSCLIHCFYESLLNDKNWEVPKSSGNTINHVISQFLKNESQINLIDPDYWPSNDKCASPSKQKSEFLFYLE